MAVHPIQIVPLRTEAAAPAAAPTLTYRGGPLLSAVQVVSLFWGSAWQQSPQAALVRELNAFFDFVLTSALLDQMSEYSVPGMAIGHGSLAGTKTLIDKSPGSTITDGAVQLLVQRELAADASLPQPNANTLYFVFLPPGTSIALGAESSCVNFCGYHSAIGGNIFYAVMPYPDCNGCLGAQSDIDALTSTCSHELCEAITDPVPGQGWYDDANGEIGDICAWQTKRLGSYAVQLEWSNRARACL
jgi:hypothetical protein